jgi:hypothetical protein
MKCDTEVLTRKMQRTHMETLCIPVLILTSKSQKVTRLDIKMLKFKDKINTVMVTFSKTKYACN